MRSTTRRILALDLLGLAGAAFLCASRDHPPSYSHSANSESSHLNEARHDPTREHSSRSNGLSGRYEGSSDGRSLVVELRDSGILVEGTISGVPVRGFKCGTTATGDFITPDGDVYFGDWSVSAENGGIDVMMTIVNLETGESHELPVVHCSATRSQEAQPRGSQSVVGRLDARLIGAWRHTQAYGSGKFSGIVEDYLWLNADGTYREGSAAAAGDLDNHLLSGPAGGEPGHWKTEDKDLYVLPAGTKTWQMWSAYACDGQRVLFEFSKGRSELWQRM